eukprot:Blabericola_migrator_1__5320@NODE_272_length_10504_cov_138_380473_g227_i0_p2_GENE_NODE_272_length_10504_cov_138_380473_g227_i0NODE_272_length_10504_cov_138_380473_g227_i0_p2_ORF_typecomplete_len296_score45_79Amidinotransf/PF02274_17/1_1e12NES_C_h/PF18208_1/0_11DUF722/PF05263_11/0_11_NODE_272_length_10504_cov_138_380473_g227_i0937510262
MSFNQSNEVGTLRRVMTKRPAEATPTQYLIDTNWEQAGWLAAPEFNAASEEHFRFIRWLQRQPMTVNYHDDEDIISLNSLAVRDCVIMTPSGIIEASLHETCRIPEPESVCSYVSQLGAPVLGSVQAPEKMNGSDFVWLNSKVLLAAVTDNTTAGAIEQVQALMKGTEVIVLELKKEVNNVNKVRQCLKNAFSPLTKNAALIAKHLFSEKDLKKLSEDLGLTLEEVTPEEYQNLGGSVVVPHQFSAAIPDKPALSRLIEEVIPKYGLKVYPQAYVALSNTGIGLGSLIVTLHRED